MKEYIKLKDGATAKLIEGTTHYYATLEGQIYSEKSKRYLKQSKNGKYAVVNLKYEGGYKTVHVHRIIAETFIPNPNNLPQVNHIDEDKHNNNVLNLEWCTPKQNSNHGSRNLKIAAKTSLPLYVYKDNEFVGKFDSPLHVSQYIGSAKQSVSNLVDTGETIFGYKVFRSPMQN